MRRDLRAFTRHSANLESETIEEDPQDTVL